MSAPLAVLTCHLVRFAAGFILLVASAFGLPGWLLLPGPSHRHTLLDIALGTVGFVVAFRAVGPLLRAAAGTPRVRPGWEHLFAELERASLPRRVFFLLLAIAEADGPLDAAERTMVRRFVLERFTDPITAQDLLTWEYQAMADPNIAALAARIGRDFDADQRDTLFLWCCLLAFVDGGFVPEEHLALQAAARGLGLQPGHARELFHRARERHLREGGPSRRTNGRARGEADGRRRRQRARGAAPPPPAGDRVRAFAVLGLPPDTPLDTVRRRHRELVKQFHPDSHPELGPIALAETTERFHQVQRAYETITSRPQP